MNRKPAAHFIDNYLINPTNAVTVTLIGAGGTGSRMLSALHCLHTALLALHFHSEIINDRESLQIEERNYNPIPQIRKVSQQEVMDNYFQIKMNIKKLIEVEVTRLKNERSENKLNRKTKSK
jgi:hypothetical protein